MTPREDAMVQSKAKSVEEYLAELPEDRRRVVAAVRDLVLRHLPEGYAEMMGFGMIGWGIPLARYPDTYNGQPLPYAGFAAQKRYYSLYLMTVYADSAEERALRAAYSKAGKRLDIGKCCLRFQRFEDLETGAIGRVLAATPPDRLIELYEASRKR
jgi:hypothetical protein